MVGSMLHPCQLLFIIILSTWCPSISQLLLGVSVKFGFNDALSLVYNCQVISVKTKYLMEVFGRKKIESEKLQVILLVSCFNLNTKSEPIQAYLF